MMPKDYIVSVQKQIKHNISWLSDRNYNNNDKIAKINAYKV